MANNPGSFMPGAGYYDPNTVWTQTYTPPTNYTYNPDWNKSAETPVVEEPSDTSGLDAQNAADAAAMDRQLQQQQYETQVRQAQEAQRQQNAISTIKGVLESYGLNSLYKRIVGFIQEGYDENAVMILIRTTPEYKTRFPAMEALAKQGRAISEAEYISYEQTASGLERRYGLPEGMLMGNVTKLLTNEVSAAELNDRVLLSSAASIQAPSDVKDKFKEFYGIDQGGLTAYFLDPDIATPLLEKKYATTLIGTEATRQGVGIDVYGAENLQALGVTQERAREGFGTVAASRGLTTGPGDVTSEKELIAGTLANDTAAQANIQRAVGGRLGRFQQGGEFLQTNQGAVGLGSAATR